jgi:DNA-binding GntR family transcriptional regulator
MHKKETIEYSENKFKVDTLQQKVYVRLKKLILTNRLKPGQKINIDQLSRDLGISHTPIREAIAMLKLDGLISTSFHKTPLVTEVNHADVIEIYDTRMMIEGHAIRQVAQSFTAEDIMNLRRSINISRDKDTTDVYMELIAQSDVFLHGYIISKVDNKLLLKLYGIIENMSLRIRTIVIANSIENIELITNEHNSIVDALETKNEERAHGALIYHLKSARQRTIEALGNM